MSFRPYGQKVTGLVSNGIDLIGFCVDGKKERERRTESFIFRKQLPVVSVSEYWIEKKNLKK